MNNEQLKENLEKYNELHSALMSVDNEKYLQIVADSFSKNISDSVSGMFFVCGFPFNDGDTPVFNAYVESLVFSEQKIKELLPEFDFSNVEDEAEGETDDGLILSESDWPDDCNDLNYDLEELSGLGAFAKSVLDGKYYWSRNTNKITWVDYGEY